MSETTVSRSIGHGHYRDIREWATEPDGQATLHESTATVAEFEDDARSYSDFHLTPSVAIWINGSRALTYDSPFALG
jgi:hypothetical protein